MPPKLAKNLANFDDLDFHVYTRQQWENLHKSHGQNIIVNYPDGHTTTGIPDHIKALNGRRMKGSSPPPGAVMHHSPRPKRRRGTMLSWINLPN